MFRNILLPLDLTDRHEAVLDIAAELARQSGGTVTLLHVIEVIPGLPVEEEQAFYQRLEKAARKHLQKCSSYLSKLGISCRQEVILGQRAAEIARVAATRDCDLVILTAPRLDPERPGAGWGSLSYKVGLLARCPVLLVK